MSRTIIDALLLALVLTVSAGSPAFAQKATASGDSTGRLIEFRIAGTSPATGRQPMKLPDTDSTVYVADSSFLSDADIVDVRSSQSGERLVLQIELTPDGSSQLASATSSHIGEPLAVLVGSRLITAPVIRTPIGRHGGVITLAVPKEAASEVAATIGKRWPER